MCVFVNFVRGIVEVIIDIVVNILKIIIFNFKIVVVGKLKME